MRNTLLLASFFAVVYQIAPAMAQSDADALPFRTIPDHPEAYTPETVAARMIEGLGFRYYWATEGLRPRDLDYRPSEEARSSFETLVHIHGLSITIRNAVEQKPNDGSEVQPEDYEGLRRATLENLWTASQRLRTGEVKLEDCKIVSQRPDGTREFPFWYNINGPIADAIWHCGQVVSFRRASGNPISNKISLFSGTVRE